MNLSHEFPILEHGHYANHAAIAPWPRAAAEAVRRFAEENRDIGPERYGHWLQMEKRLRGRLAGLINAASPDDIALLKNTTEGICTVANGIRWRTGDNLVLPAGEFPSNRLPWLALQSKGVEVRQVDIRDGGNPEQNLIDHMDEHTRLLAVSAIQWTDGLRLRLGKLGACCRRHGVLFFVDAIQQLGAISLDVQDAGIDFLAADGHKWMLAPEGVAVFYCRQAVREQMDLAQVGWRMVDEPYRFDRDDWRPSASASRFEAGSPNTLGQVALDASLALLQEFGMPEVERLVTENSEKLSLLLDGLPGVELARPFDPQRVSGIVSFSTPGRDPAEVHRALKLQRVVCAVRDGAIRLSPHFYQAGAPLEDLLEAVEGSII